MRKTCYQKPLPQRQPRHQRHRGSTAPHQRIQQCRHMHLTIIRARRLRKTLLRPITTRQASRRRLRLSSRVASLWSYTASRHPGLHVGSLVSLRINTTPIKYRNKKKKIDRIYGIFHNLQVSYGCGLATDAKMLGKMLVEGQGDGVAVRGRSAGTSAYRIARRIIPFSPYPVCCFYFLPMRFSQYTYCHPRPLCCAHQLPVFACACAFSALWQVNHPSSLLEMWRLQMIAADRTWHAHQKMGARLVESTNGQKPSSNKLQGLAGRARQGEEEC